MPVQNGKQLELNLKPKDREISVEQALRVLTKERRKIQDRLQHRQKYINKALGLEKNEPFSIQVAQELETIIVSIKRIRKGFNNLERIDKIRLRLKEREKPIQPEAGQNTIIR